MRRRWLAAAALAALTPAGLLAQGGREAPGRVIDVRPDAVSRPSLESLWGDYQRALTAGDADAAAKAMAGLVQMRAERNIRGLEPMALALISQGLEQLGKGERAAAETDFKRALSLDPDLPDADFALAQAQMRRGPLGIAPAMSYVISGVLSRLDTWRGRERAQTLVIPALLLALLLTAASVSLALLVQYGGLLLHDLDEQYAPTRGPMFARALFVAALLLPLILLQGYAWLPLWWLALLFVYLSATERAAAIVLLLASIAAGPLVATVTNEARAFENPLFRVGLAAVRGGPDERISAALERAAAENQDDKDFRYLLARAYRKAGRDDDAAAVYRELLADDPKDPVALNNLANIDFYKGDYDAAKARYKQGAELGVSHEISATFLYNLSLAHLQKFEFQPATDVRGQADRADGGLTRQYESLWRYDKAGTPVSAVVDLSLSEEQLAAKFAGAAQGVALKNVAGRRVSAPGASGLPRSLLTRFLAFGVLFALAVLAVSSWRGRKLFTLRCSKCGTPFCRRCHLGQVAGGLCTQCYHLFVVKDGVSASARNQKLSEVQREDARRARVFRVLSLLSPGAGQVYAHQALPGLLIALAWYLLLSLLLLAGRPFSLTGASGSLLGPWVLAPPLLAMLLIYLVANQWRPSVEVDLPMPRRPPARRPSPMA